MSSNLLPYLPFQKPHSLLCLVMTLFDSYCMFFILFSYLSGGVVDLVAHNGGGDEEDEDNMSRSWQGR